MPKISTSEVELRKDLILDAAIQVFERDGFTGASMRKIAQVSGVTTGAIYPHFSSKEDIYAELLSRSVASIYDAIQQSFDDRADPKDKLLASANAFLDYYEDRPFEFELCVYIFMRTANQSFGKSRDKQLNAELEKILDIFGAHFSACANTSEKGSLMPGRAGLYAFLTGVMMLEHSGRAKSIKTSRSQLLESYFDLLFGE